MNIWKRITGQEKRYRIHLYSAVIDGAFTMKAEGCRTIWTSSDEEAIRKADTIIQSRFSQNKGIWPYASLLHQDYKLYQKDTYITCNSLHYDAEQTHRSLLFVRRNQVA